MGRISRRHIFRLLLGAVPAPTFVETAAVLPLGRADTDELATGFAEPPSQAKPRVFWWWLNNLVNKEGITRDLEEFKAKGIGGVILFAAGGGNPMPAGPSFLGPEWRELFKHALREAGRLSIEVGVNLCGGWDMGGPWIAPEHGLKKVVQSEVSVRGPQKFSGKLPQPGDEGVSYWDVAVQAFPSGKTPIQLRVKASSSEAGFPCANAVDGIQESYWASRPRRGGPTRESPDYIRFEFSVPVRTDRLSLVRPAGCGPRKIDVQTSRDGRNFTTIQSFTLEDNVADVLSFPETTSQHFRLCISSSYGSENSLISEASFVDPKTGARWAARTKLLDIKCARDFSDGFSATENVVRKDVEAPLQHFSVDSNEAAIDAATIVDLTTRMRPDGQLEWDVPAGLWTILRTGYSITGRRTSQPCPGGDGLEVDFLNGAAMEFHFDRTARLLLEDAGSLAGKTLKYFHDDSWEDFLPNWTHRFLEEFKKRRGYDAKPFLPVLTGRTVISPEVSDRFLYDYRKTIADCLAENHYGRFRDLCHANGVLMHNESGGPCAPWVPPMDALKNLGRSDIPMGEFWQSDHWKEHTQNAVGKQTAAAAHIYGKRLAAAEAFTKMNPLHALQGPDCHWQEAPSDLKPTADIAFCEGINLFFIHTATSTRPEDGKPGYEYFAGTHFNPNITWWSKSGAWLSYISRCQYLLQRGLPVGDVCYYYGDNAPNLVEPKHLDPSLGPGYDYDVCNAEVLLTRMSVKDGRVVLPDGVGYRLLVLPGRKAMPVEVLRRVKQLVELGATVVGPKPEHDPGLKNYPGCDAEVRTLASALWGSCDGVNVKERRLANGRIIWGKPLREVLLAGGLKPDFECAAARKDAFLDYIHRRDGETEIYFVANRLGRWEEVNCTFRVAGKMPELWDPVTGQIDPAATYSQSGGRTTLPLEFAPYGSMFVVFRKATTAKRAARAMRNSPVLSRPHEITGQWAVNFDEKSGGPGVMRFERLISWTEHPEGGVKYFSGTATYVKEFDLPAELRMAGQRLVLDLGAVRSIAEVRLSGRNLGVLWTAPFRVDITGVAKRTGNRLEIEVTNLWPNRLIGDAWLPENRRLTRTNRGFPRETPLLESGLLGPVALRAVV